MEVIEFDEQRGAIRGSAFRGANNLESRPARYIVPGTCPCVDERVIPLEFGEVHR